MESDLFRPEVLNFQKAPFAGEVVLIQPLGHLFLVGVAGAILLALALVLFFAEYTRHTLIGGVTEPRAGLAKLYAPQPGMVGAVMVREGQHVTRGQILLRASAERRNGSGDDVQQEMDTGAKRRLATLQDELRDTIRLSGQELRSNEEALATLQRSRVNLTAQLEAQARRVKAADETLNRFRSLREAGFVSELQLTQQQAAHLDQQLRLDALHKDAIAVDGEITRLMREQHSLPLKQRVSQTQLERGIASVQGEIAQLVGEHGWSVVAPADGIVSAVAVVPGQTMSTGTALLSIVPEHSVLHAKLYAPSRALGFIQVGASVNLRLEAFPYQKFGVASGRITSIADAPTPMNEFTSNTTAMPKSLQSQEPLFAIAVELDRDYLLAYGNRQRLRTGMQLEGDVQLDRRKLYEWLFEPLFALQGR